MNDGTRCWMDNTLKWASMEHQRFLVLEVRWFKSDLVAVMYNRCTGSLDWQKWNRQGHCPIQRMSVNRVSKIVGFASRVIYVPIGWSHLLRGYWQPWVARTTARSSLRCPGNEHQRSVNNFCSCIFGNQGITRLFEHITELLTASIGKNTIYQRTNTDSKIIDIAHCTICTNTLLAVECTILIRHYDQSEKTRA